MSTELDQLESIRERLDETQAGPDRHTLNDIALTHIESAIGALEDLERIKKEKNDNERNRTSI